jgi:GNAT superfamily N-acetyltransferase
MGVRMIAVREAEPGDAEGMAAVQVAGWQHAYASFMPAEFIAARTPAIRTGEWRDRLDDPPADVVHVVAEDEGRIVGIASGGPPMGDEVVIEGNTSDYEGQCYGLYVAPDRIGHGIGHRLLGRLSWHLLSADHTSLVLWAFEKNAYRGFYDRLGGREIAKGRWEVDGITLIEIAYGWPDIGHVIHACLNRSTKH